MRKTEDGQKKKWSLKKKILVLGGIVLAVAAGIAIVVFGGNKLLQRYVQSKADSMYEAYEVTAEKLEEMVPVNSAQAEKIDAMPGYSKEDTWAFYIYMVGADLESCQRNELSYLNLYLLSPQVAAIEQEKREALNQGLQVFVQEVEQQGGQLPKRLYNPMDTIGKGDEEQEKDDGEYRPGNATYNLRQMLNADLGDQIKIVIQTGGARRWEDVRINPNRSQRFLIDGNGMQEVYNGNLVNMADKDTLADFLTYCRKNYRADHEVVVFWNHGGGISGYGLDEIYGGMLSVREMEEAFAKAVGRNEKEPPFEAIGFDACLMASTEVADAFSGFAKYLYASEEVEPGHGWDYTAFLNALSEEPTMNGAQLGKALADGFIEQSVQDYAGFGLVPEVTFSVTDLSKVHQVYEAYGRFAQSALQDVLKDPAVLSEISRAAAASVAYATTSYEDYNTIDLGMFMEELPERYQAEGRAVISAIEDCVLYARNSLFMEGSKGLSIYYPQYTTAVGIRSLFLPYINKLSRNQDINALYYYKLAGCLNEEYQAYVKSKGYDAPKVIDYSVMEKVADLPLTCTGDGNLELTLDEELLALTQNVTFGIAKYDDETGEIIYYGEDAYASLKEDGSITTFFDGKWITYGELPLQLEVVSSTAESALFRSSILYNSVPSYMLIAYDGMNDEVSLLGISRMNNEATLDRNLMHPQMGDIIIPVLETGNLYDNTMQQKQDMMIIVDKDAKLEEMPLEDGTYLEYLNVKDLRSDEYTSATATFTMEKGKLKDQALDDSFIAYERD